MPDAIYDVVKLQAVHFPLSKYLFVEITWFQ